MNHSIILQGYIIMTVLRKKLQDIIDAFRKQSDYPVGNHVAMRTPKGNIVIYDNPGADYEYFVVTASGISLSVYRNEVKLGVNDVGAIAEYNLVAWALAVYNQLTR